MIDLSFVRIPLPWRVRRFLAWLYVNRHVPITALRRMGCAPRYRIMLSTAFFGGVGGTEKHLKALVESMPESQFYIRARDVKTQGFVPTTHNFSVNWTVHSGTRFDLYLYFAGGGKPPFEGEKFAFRKKMVETNGTDVRSIEGAFDYIAIQTGNYQKYCDQHEKCLLAFPDVPSTFPTEREAIDLPERYFLTVFNPFSNALKGNDLLYRMADAAALPIVWCYSDKSGFDFSDLPDHPNIIKQKNLSQPQLYYAYENASAYVSFSHIESFGWSLAEAFYLGLPIIAREVGFLTYVKDQPGIHIYTDEEGLRTLLSQGNYQRQDHDDSLFKRNAYSAVINHILA